jgi:hypothetical protein
MPKLGDFERLVRVASGESVNVFVSDSMDYDTEQGTDTTSGRKYWVYLLKCRDSSGPIVLRGGRGMIDALVMVTKGLGGKEIRIKLSRQGTGLSTQYFGVIV